MAHTLSSTHLHTLYIFWERSHTQTAHKNMQKLDTISANVRIDVQEVRKLFITNFDHFES